ncbi:hypothetical protein [Laspinema olomoucense]|uniref:Uncharacterized protein n=1 Tax=Laspinema olomoucense D3b TaxID=2953688 RepID=A0ABT2NAM1_9CYAN|nr:MULTISPECIES: hypothetical protein [unclassified Laspinema]MCT7971322.1 hypothetical protein [Laspinema sp. D3d]MCT7979516.1 hypothetical protein [Laspinema sp. D3b]MCT7987672.1 hypothetical protein [Laspinema sp. D3a]
MANSVVFSWFVGTSEVVYGSLLEGNKDCTIAPKRVNELSQKSPIELKPIPLIYPEQSW